MPIAVTRERRKIKQTTGQFIPRKDPSSKGVETRLGWKEKKCRGVQCWGIAVLSAREIGASRKKGTGETSKIVSFTLYSAGMGKRGDQAREGGGSKYPSLTKKNC